VPKELQTHCTCPDWANPCKHVAAVCYVMAEVLDRDPWILFDLRGRTQEDILEMLQSLSTASSNGQTPRKRGRPKKETTVLEMVTRKKETPKPWRQMPEEEFDAQPALMPSVAIPRNISSDPSVFVQLGPLPHAPIEASLCLAALMHRTAQVVQKQIEDGVGVIEDNGTEGESEAETASPFETPLPPQTNQRFPRSWRHKRKRWQTS
jgi:uncharacterized Zn finger protein